MFLICLFAVFGYAAALDMPGGSPPKNAVPIGLLEKMALAIGEEISGTHLVAGKPIPYCNLGTSALID